MPNRSNTSDVMNKIIRRQGSGGLAQDEDFALLWGSMQQKVADALDELSSVNDIIDAIPHESARSAQDRLDDFVDSMEVVVEAIEEVETFLGIQDELLEPGSIDLFDEVDEDEIEE